MEEFFFKAQRRYAKHGTSTTEQQTTRDSRDYKRLQETTKDLLVQRGTLST